MKKLLLLLLLIPVLFITVPSVDQGNDRKDYVTYLKKHPYHPVNRHQENVESIPRQDRPDLAWEQNYLMTMDPQLKRPAPERLAIGRTQIAEYFARKAKQRTGTEDFPWEERGPREVGGRTRAVMWDPNDPEGDKVWAGGVSGGLWVNENIFDETSPWKKVDDFWESIGITSMAYDPTDPLVFYVGTGESAGGATRGEGIYKSIDGGENWTQLASTEEFYYVNDIVVRDEDGTGVIYAAVAPTYYRGDFHGVPNLGLQRSINGGSSFDQVFPNISLDEATPHAIADLELAGDNSLWAGTVQNVYGEGGGYILTSTDGTTWEVSTQRSPGNRIMIASAPSNSSVLYALVESSGEVEEVIKTTDGGTSWTSLPEPNDADDNIDAGDFSRGQAWYDLIVRVDPNDENSVLVGAIDLFKTSDGGSTWNQISHWYGGFGFQYVHADQHAILFEPGSSSNVLFGNDGGVFVSSNMENSDPDLIDVSARNNSYNVTQFYSCAIHPTQNNYFLAGSQDNGTQQFKQAGISDTEDIFGGDGAFCFIDQHDGNFQISSYVYNVYGLNTNNGDGGMGSFNSISEDQSTGRFINPADYDDSLGILYTATDEASIGRFTDVRTGSPVRDDFDIALEAMTSHLRVSPYQSTSTTLFVGTEAGTVFKIEGAEGTSPTPTDISGNLPVGYVSCIEVGESEEQLLVTFSSYGVDQVWVTADGGTSWTAKDGNLPDMPVRWALYNPNNRLEVILATELGIWRTVNINASEPVWEPSNIGLANVRVDMLQIRDSDHEVIAATHGRGLYSSYGFTTSEPPFAPSELIATVISPFELLLEWTDNADNETGFVLERSTDGVSFEEVVLLEPNVLSYTDTGIDHFTDYVYRIKATNNAGSSEYTLNTEVSTPEALPDLLFTDFTVAQNMSMIDLSVEIINSGYLDTEADVDVTVYWSEEETFSETSSTLFYSTTLNGLVTDNSQQIFEALEIPDGFGSGTFHFFAFADENDLITEHDEENNGATASIGFIPLATPGPEKAFRIYPVPFRNELTIEALKDNDAELTFEIVDLSGKSLRNGYLTSKKTQLDLSGLHSGIYQLIVNDGKKQTGFKLFKK